MRTMKTPDAPPPVIVAITKSSKIMSARLTIRSDEATRRKAADTDGTLRRARELAERNRLILTSPSLAQRCLSQQPPSRLEPKTALPSEARLVSGDRLTSGRVTMATIELITVEERPGGQLLFNVRVTSAAGKIELPISIEGQGSVASNETTVLQVALGFATELEASVRLRLGVEQ